jgi:hypothetical protein
VFALVVIGITHLLGVLYVPPPLLAAGTVAPMMAGPTSPGTGGAEPSSKRALAWSFLPVSSWYAYVVGRRLAQLPLLLFLS